MTKPTPSASPAPAHPTRPVGAWRVEGGAGGPRPLDPAALPAVPDLVRGQAEDGTGAVTWARLADLDALHDVAALVDPGARSWAVHPPRSPSGTHRPLAHVRRLAADWLLVVVPTVWFTPEDRQVHTGGFASLVGRGVVLTAETGGAATHDAVLDRLSSPGTPRGSGARRVTAAVVMAVVASASAVELELGDSVADTERVVFDEARADPVERIYDLKREITEARHALLPVTAELPELLDEDMPAHLGLDRHVLDRLVATVERIDRHLDSHDDLLSDMLQVHMSQVSVRQNEDMRRISAWAAVLVYPTIVAGVYGMNFRVMPELHWALGYPFALALMAGGCVVLHRLFRRAGWL